VDVVGTGGLDLSGSGERFLALLRRLGGGGGIWLGLSAEHTEQAILCSSRPTDDR